MKEIRDTLPIRLGEATASLKIGDQEMTIRNIKIKEVTEATIQKEIMAAIGAEKDLLLLRNNVGCLKDENLQWVRYGLGVGSPDLVGFLHSESHAKMVAFEVKRPGQKLSREQEETHEMWKRFGVRIAVVHSAKEAIDALWYFRRDLCFCGHSDCLDDEELFRHCYRSRL